MKNNINQTGKVIALLSFVLGTTLLSFFLYFGPQFIGLGFALFCVVFMIITNIAIFAAIVGSAILKKVCRLDAFKTCCIMLLNIPVAILYFIMVITFPYKNLII
ncbi:hypothetical protein [Psychroserpens sp. MEBiC05023]